jgi:hypothetical protein
LLIVSHQPENKSQNDKAKKNQEVFPFIALEKHLGFIIKILFI